MVCLFGCRRGEIEYPFPKYRQNPKMFVAWIKALQNTLSNTLIDVATFEQIKLCAYHFRAQDKVNICNKKLLLATAIPQHSLFTPVNLDHSYNKLVCLTKVQPEPTLGPTVTANKDCGIRLDDIKKENDGRLTVLTPVQEKPETPEVKNMKPNNDQHQFVLESRIELLRAKIRRVQYKSQLVKNQVRRMKKKTEILKSRLPKSTNLGALAAVIRHMTPAAKMFTMTQYKQNKPQQRRRFSMFDKMFSLALFNTSPAAYRLFARHFALPSVRTIKKEKAKHVIKTVPYFEEMMKVELDKCAWEDGLIPTYLKKKLQQNIEPNGCETDHWEPNDNQQNDCNANDYQQENVSTDHKQATCVVKYYETEDYESYLNKLMNDDSDESQQNNYDPIKITNGLGLLGVNRTTYWSDHQSSGELVNSQSEQDFVNFNFKERSDCKKYIKKPVKMMNDESDEIQQNNYDAIKTTNGLGLLGVNRTTDWSDHQSSGELVISQSEQDFVKLNFKERSDCKKYIRKPVKMMNDESDEIQQNNYDIIKIINGLGVNRTTHRSDHQSSGELVNSQSKLDFVNLNFEERFDCKKYVRKPVDIKPDLDMPVIDL